MRGRGSHVGKCRDRFPGGLVALATARQRAPPVPDHAIPEDAERRAIKWHSMIGESACHDVSQPTALLLDPRMPVLPQALPDFAQLGAQAVAARLSPRRPVSGASGRRPGNIFR
jgi:hypothetical protein